MAEDARPEDKAIRREAIAKWKAIVAEYQKPNFWRASWQLVNTIGAYAGLWYLMYLTLPISWWLTIPAGGPRRRLPDPDLHHLPRLRARLLFQIAPGQRHRGASSPACSPSRPTTTGAGSTPCTTPRTGDLDRRGMGDVWTMTVRGVPRILALEAVRLPAGPQPVRAVRHRAALPVPGLRSASLAERRTARTALRVDRMNLGDPRHGRGADRDLRLSAVPDHPADRDGGGRRRRASGCSTCSTSSRTSTGSAATTGITRPRRCRAAPSTSCRSVLQWFSGNIGFHHIHHLSSRIPNYNLERCHRSDPMFAEVKPMTLLGSLRSIRFRLWDEEARKLTGFGHLKKQRKAQRGDGKAANEDRHKDAGHA